MSKRVADAFKNGKAFVAYLMAGDPGLDKTADFILALQRAGADLVEVGIPFSDPIAEGPVIQEASVRALAAGTTTDGVFDMLESIRDRVHIPLVFMTYINVVFHYGYERFFERCNRSGVSGVILPDAPFEEQAEVAAVADGFGIDSISLIAPTSAQRIGQIAKGARGFVYLVSSMGVTGVRSEITTDVASMVQAVRDATDIPVAVGFGISTPEQAGRFAAMSDGVIVGSAIVRIIAEHGGNADEPLAAYVRSLREGMR